MADNQNFFQQMGFGGIPAGLLSPAQEQQIADQAQRQAALVAGLQMISGATGARGEGKPGLARIVSQAGIPAFQAYQQATETGFGNILKGVQIQQALKQANAPQYKTLKSGDNEILVEIPVGGGTPRPVTIPGMQGGSAIKFDAQTQGFANLVFGKPFNELTADQQNQVISFSLAPDDAKMAELRAKAQEIAINAPGGATIPLPKSRRDIIAETLSGLTNRSVTPPAAQPQTQAVPASPIVPPPAQPSVKQMSAPAGDVTGGMVKTSATVQLPAGMAEKPLAENETPLINSKGISPKQKSELELLKPQSFTSVETALNTTRQIRSEINRILENPSFNLAFGFGGETVSGIYTPAADIRAKLEQIKNQLFVEGITALRNASPTGAGVGSVTNQEGGRFENLRGALVQFQSADQARAELARIEKELEASERRIENGFTRVYGTTKFDVSPLYTPSKKGDLRGILFPGKKKQ
jgi:hypothetical protein